MILLTAMDSAESKIKGLENHADDYVTKPFRSLELRMRIRNLIAVRHLLQIKYGHYPTIEATDVNIVPRAQIFLDQAQAIVEKHIADTEFKVTDLAAMMSMSPKSMTRKMKKLVHKTPIEFITEIRLSRASRLLDQGAFATVKQVGFCCWV